MQHVVVLLIDRCLQLLPLLHIGVLRGQHAAAATHRQHCKSHHSAVDHYHTAVVTHWQHCCRSAVLSILSLLSISKSHQCYRLPSQCCVASWQHCKLSTIVTNTAVVTHRQHSVVLSKLLLPSIGKSYQSAFYYHHNVALPVGNTASLTVMQFIINLLLP